MLQMNDTDIERVERLLLPEGKTFNAERRAFIRCMESRDVVACPGSGKTTALLAKLLILANKMPFEDGRGVCVLTHTNVAIAEIKNRAGSVADSLFRHPNFFGTIQSFVNKFLAIPAYRMEFGNQLQSIENETYLSAFHKLFSCTRKAQYRLPNLGWDEQRIAFLSLSPRNLSVADALKSKIPKLKESEISFSEIVSIRKALLDNGIISYNDAFPMAKRYLTLHPQIIAAFHERFIFCFIDEMQDTDIQQLDVLDMIFSDDKVVLQRLGDPNQAIFHSAVQKDMNWQPAGNPPLLFSDSLRYGKSIADLLSTVRVDNSISLLPNPEQESFPPHMLLFEEGDEQSVIPAFASLILNFNLSDRSGGKFKAVGWVGKDNRSEDKLCIPSYFCLFEKNPAKKRNQFSNLLSYICAIYTDCDCKCAENLYRAIIRGVVHAVTLANFWNPNNNRAFTSSAYMRFLKESNEKAYNSLRQTVSFCVLERQREQITSKQVRDYIAKFLRKLYFSFNNNEWNVFLCNDVVEVTENSNQKSSNTFMYNDINIDVATVHSVKGETHAATLYMETSYYGTDSKRLLPFLKGEYPVAESKKVHHIENLKMAHVAFSRATYLVVFACLATEVEGHEDALKKNGWIIKRVKELIDMEEA